MKILGIANVKAPKVQGTAMRPVGLEQSELMCKISTKSDQRGYWSWERSVNYINVQVINSE